MWPSPQRPFPVTEIRAEGAILSIHSRLLEHRYYGAYEPLTVFEQYRICIASHDVKEPQWGRPGLNSTRRPSDHNRTYCATFAWSTKHRAEYQYSQLRHPETKWFMIGMTKRMLAIACTLKRRNRLKKLWITSKKSLSSIQGNCLFASLGVHTQLYTQLYTQFPTQLHIQLPHLT